MLDLPQVTDGTAQTSIANWMLYGSALRWC